MTLRLALALLLCAASLCASFAASPPSAPAPDAPKFLNAPFASDLAPSAIRAAAARVAAHHLAAPAPAGEAPAAAALWREGLLTAAELTGDARLRTATEALPPASPEALAALADSAPAGSARATALRLHAARAELAALTEAQRWTAPSFPVLTSMANRKIGSDADFAAAALGTHALVWGVNQPLGIMVIDYFRVPLITGWRSLLSRVAADGSIAGPPSEARLRAGAFLLAAREVLALSEFMAKPQPYTRSERYLKDLATQNELLARAEIPSASDSLSVLRRATAWQLRNLDTKSGKTPDAFWLRGTFFAGITAIYHKSGDNYYLRVAREQARKNEFKPGHLADGVHGADDIAISQLYLDLYALDKKPEQLAPTRAALDAVLAKSRPGAFEWYWVDALFMAPPVWHRMANLTGEEKYREHANTLFWETSDKLWDAETGLTYRDRTYIVQPDGMQLREVNGEKVFWGRGNGWLVGALCLVLDQIPADHPERPRYETRLKTLLASLAKLQQPTGLWPTSLLDQQGYPMGDTSATTLFAYGYAWALNRGLLDQATYLPVALKAWAASVACVDEHGRLTYVQSQADSTRAYVYRTTNHEYGTGTLLLAGSEMLPLLRARDAAQKPAAPGAKTIDPAAPDRILPPAALRSGPLQPADHVWAEAINTFLQRQPAARIAPTGLTKADYLKFVRAHVLAYRKDQRADGAVTDAAVPGRMDYITPAYAMCVAGLVALDGERDPALIESGARALDYAVDALARGRPAFVHSHSEFWPFPTLIAIDLITPHVPAERSARWRAQLAKVDADKAYFLPRSSFNNWTLKGAAGEFLRAKMGLTDLSYTDACLEFQRHFFTEAGMFNELKAFAYDGFPRYVLTGMLEKGYRGAQFEFYRDRCWRGAWSQLFLQSAHGEGPTGGRSTHHVWNETQITAMSEIYAAHYARAGRLAEAGAFKRAARLAFQASLAWRQPDGTATMVKNHFPPTERFGYHNYSYVSNYNLYACAMLVTAAMVADETIAEKPAPADVGGYVLEAPGFDMVFANAAGHSLQYCTQGDMLYQATGLNRLHLRGAPSAFGPSDPVVNRGFPETNDWGFVFATDELKPVPVELARKMSPAFLAVGPAWFDAKGEETRLSAYPHARWFGAPPTDPDLEPHGKLTVLEATPERIRFRADFAVRGGTVSETLTLDAAGLRGDTELKVRGAERGRLTFPALAYDGRDQVAQQLSGNRLALRLPSGGVEFTVLAPAGVTLTTGPEKLRNRSGFITPVLGDFSGPSASYQIRALP